MSSALSALTPTGTKMTDGADKTMPAAAASMETSAAASRLRMNSTRSP
jgi:hypothetical protein